MSERSPRPPLRPGQAEPVIAWVHMLEAFEGTYQSEFGFVLENRDIIVDNTPTWPGGARHCLVAHAAAVKSGLQARCSELLHQQG